MANTEHIMKALAGLIPEEAQKEVSTAVTSFLESAVADLEKEYSERLKEAYKVIGDEKAEDDATTEAGYAQAWDIITTLREYQEIQKEEFEQALEEGYEQAYQMLQEERSKNDTLEVSLYEEYDKRMQEVKEYMVDKIDQFLSLQGDKYYEMAKRDLLNDPAVSEHRLAFDKILEVAQNYLSDEDYAYATSSRIDGLNKRMDEQQAQIKILEAKNMRLGTENSRLTEAVKHQNNLLSESVKNERTARAQKAKQAQGRGKSNTEHDRHVVIGERRDISGEPVSEQLDERSHQRFAEQVGEEVFADWKYLANRLSPLAEDQEKNLRISTR